jgi:hypothetical protein
MPSSGSEEEEEELQKKKIICSFAKCWKFVNTSKKRNLINEKL